MGLGRAGRAVLPNRTPPPPGHYVGKHGTGLTDVRGQRNAAVVAERHQDVLDPGAAVEGLAGAAGGGAVDGHGGDGREDLALVVAVVVVVAVAVADAEDAAHPHHHDQRQRRRRVRRPLVQDPGPPQVRRVPQRHLSRAIREREAPVLFGVSRPPLRARQPMFLFLFFFSY